MLDDSTKERLRRLAQNATPGPRRLFARDISLNDAVQRGEDPIDVAAADRSWGLGWDIVDWDKEGLRVGFAHAPGCDLASKDAALVMATPPEVILALLDEIDRLHDAT